MKKYATYSIGVILCLISVTLVYAQSDTGVHFIQGLSWEQVKEKAKSENKFVFVDCYASWCGPCKEMDMNIYPKEKIGKFINERFISIRAQMDTSKQDDDHIKQFYADAHYIMQEYKINAFPSLLFFSPKGKIVHKVVGYLPEDNLITFSEDAMDSNKQFYTLVGKFKEHHLDTSYMMSLARYANFLGDTELAGKIANEYIDRLSEIQIYQREIIEFMLEFTTSSMNRGFAVLKDHVDMICQGDSNISKEEAKGFIENIIYNEAIKPCVSSKNGRPDWAKMKINVKKYGMLGEEALKKHTLEILFKSEILPALKIDPNWSKAFALIKKQNAGKGEEFLVGSTIVYYLNNGLGSGNTGDCKNFMSAATLYFNKYYSFLSAVPLNNWAWEVFERSSDKDVLTTALVWSDSSLKLSAKPDAILIDTYANLLYKIGKTQEAIAWEERAISLTPSNEDIRKNYVKMKRGQPTWGTD